MRFTKEEIRKANELNIIDVAASELGMTLKRQGATVMTLCPCHEDTHPSMQLGGRRNIAHCYVCGKTLTPLSLVMEVTGKSFKEAMEVLGVNHWGQTPLIQSTSQRVNKSTSESVRSDPMNHWGQPPLIQYIGMEYVQSHVSVDNALSKCLLHRFPREVVERVTRMYMLGHDENLLHYEHTWFPSIDVQGRCHNIKVQGYCTNPDVPMFGHSVKGQTMWLGAVLQKRGLMDKEKAFDNECLFSPPLTPPGGSTYILVESPKNAVVGACWTLAERPDLNLTWVAVGNKGMLKREVLEPLRGRKVLVIPDRDAVEEWKQKIDKMRDLATFIFSDFCQSQEQAENKKLDIADLILKK